MIYIYSDSPATLLALDSKSMDSKLVAICFAILKNQFNCQVMNLLMIFLEIQLVKRGLALKLSGLSLKI